MFWLLLCLLLACAVCSWLCPSNKIAVSAVRALDSSINLLSRGYMAEDDDAPRHPPDQRAPLLRDVASCKTHGLPVKRKRVTPFVSKKVAAMYKWRCAACSELLTEDFEVDHHVSLQNGGTNDISNLRPLHKRCHLLKNSFEQRRR